MINPRRMAEIECGNFRSDGGCLGIPVECLTSDRPTVAAPLDRCKLACKKIILDEPREFFSFAQLDRFLDQAEDRAGKSGNFHLSKYFEKAVLPLARYWPKYLDAVEQYNWQRTRQGKDPIAIFKQSKSRFCKCGSVLPRRRRVCKDCQRKRRRESYRKANRKRRKPNGNDDNS